MFFTEPTIDYENKILHLLSYHPYWIVFKEIRNPYFDKTSSEILRFKNNDMTMINALHKRLSPLISRTQEITICVVPAHLSKGTNDYTPLSILAKKLSKSNNLKDGSNCLIRHTDIPKLSNGGNRDSEVHFNSIKIEHPDLIRNQNVLLIDDITTTGNSLNACKRLLLDAGALQVCMLAISQTSNDKDRYWEEQMLALKNSLVRTHNPQN